MRAWAACGERSPREAQVTLADAQLCGPGKDVLPLTPAAVSRCLVVTFVLEQTAARGQPGEAELSSQEGPGGGGHKSVAELVTLFDRINRGAIQPFQRTNK